MYKTIVCIYKYTITRDGIEDAEMNINAYCKEHHVTVKSATTAMMGATAITTVVFEKDAKEREVE